MQAPVLACQTWQIVDVGREKFLKFAVRKNVCNNRMRVCELHELRLAGRARTALSLFESLCHKPKFVKKYFSELFRRVHIELSSRVLVDARGDLVEVCVISMRKFFKVFRVNENAVVLC